MTPLVSIQCAVYNHEPFLRRCLDGFVMQRTDFPFEVVVHDDASTDGSAAIILEYAERYPNIIRPIIEKENLWSKRDGSMRRMWKRELHGKYIAICEGDDCWTDPLKLQKQISFMESHPQYGASYSSFSIIDKDDNPLPDPEWIEIRRNRCHSGFLFADLLYGNFPQTLTVVYRADVRGNDVNPPYLFDYSYFLDIALHTKYYYLPENTGCYRLNPNGLTQLGLLGKLFDSTEVKLYFFDYWLHHKSEACFGLYEKVHLLKFFFDKMSSENLRRRYPAYYQSIFRSSFLCRIAFSLGKLFKDEINKK